MYADGNTTRVAILRLERAGKIIPKRPIITADYQRVAFEWLETSDLLKCLHRYRFHGSEKKPCIIAFMDNSKSQERNTSLPRLLFKILLTEIVRPVAAT